MDSLRKKWRFAAAAAASAAGAALLFSACTGKEEAQGTGISVPYTGVAAQAAVTPANAAAVLNDVSAFVPTCAAVTPPAAGAQVRAVARAAGSGGVAATPTVHARALTAVQPADRLGPCGGRITYKNYNHSSGTTTATYSFVNYCTTDAATGHNITINGDIPFVNAGTPSPTGPITTSFVANAPLITVVETSGAAVVNSSSLGFAGFTYTPGTPGATPTDAKPDTYTLGRVIMSNSTINKSVQVENATMTLSNPAAGGTKESFTGRLYTSPNGYVDVTTPTPLLIDNLGNFTAGAFTFTGSGGSNATLTVTPGATMALATMVNGLAQTITLGCSTIAGM